MPTAWLPWPGNMKARIVVSPIEAAALEMLRWLGKFGAVN